MTLTGLLASADLEVAEAQSGQAAVERIGVENPDAVVMDARHSALDGLTVLRRIRAMDLKYHIPMLLLFSEADRTERLLALKQGADDALAAPWDSEELLARVQRSLVLKRRVDELITEGEKLERLSFTDGLTQVNNHRYFQERLADEFRRAQRYDDPLSLILLDLDHFKAVNDAHGHPTGDLVLKAVADALRQNVRETDVLARYGGEEFAVMLPQTHLAGSLTVAERIRKDIQALRLGPQATLRVTASFGIAGFPSPTISVAEQLVASADDALYRAKHEGRNRICLAQAGGTTSPFQAQGS